MKNSKTKTEVASSAETSKPAEPQATQDNAIAVSEQPVQEGSPQDSFVGIADLVKDIPDSKVEMAEGLGIPIKGILRWAFVIEANVKAQGKALQQLGVNLQPVVELAQKVKASQQNPAALTSETGNQGNLGTIVSLVKEAMGTQTGGMSEGDRYFMEMGRESASLGNFVAKELFKKMMPEAIAKFDSERAAAK